MKVVYKYPLELEDKQIVQIPSNSKIVHVGLDPNGILCLWAEIDRNENNIDWKIHIVGTGHERITNNMVHLGSLLTPPFVWHVYLEV